MKYYIISAAINLGILLIPIATPVLKQKLEEKKEKLFLDITQGIPGVGLYRDYHFCLFGIYQP